jgi:quinol monooxygenase YgiN
MGEPVILHARFTARPEQLTTVERLIRGLAADVAQEPGNVEFTVYQEALDRCRFFVFERYVDRAAFEAHLAADYGAAFNAKLTDLIVENGSRLTFLRASGTATHQADVDLRPLRLDQPPDVIRPGRDDRRLV